MHLNTKTLVCFLGLFLFLWRFEAIFSRPILTRVCNRNLVSWIKPINLIQNKQKCIEFVVQTPSNFRN